MKTIRLFTTLAIVAAAMAACSSMPPANAMLDQARSDYRQAQANTQTQALAPVELKQAGEALALANAAFAREDEPAKVDQLAYLSRQRTALAQETAGRKISEAAVAAATADRDKARLEARTQEADRATRSAAVATAEAASSKRQSEAATRAAVESQRMAAASQLQAAASQQQAVTSQQQAGEAERRSQMLEAQMRDMKAQKTDRGMVVTIGDLLFDTGRAALKSGGVRDMERIGSFLREYPQRKASIEGYTDSTGSDASNQTLSERRADAVMTTLLGMGVGRQQLTAQGYGESHPVAGNDNAGGRQMNRRVEIVLSDENGVLRSR